MADLKSIPVHGIADKFVVYGLYDPRDGELRYIGKTISGVRARLKGHICDAKRHEHTHVGRWIRSMLALGLKPEPRVLETSLFPEMLGDVERKWIAWAKKKKLRLTNVSDGGDGGSLGWKPSEATLARFRARPNVWRGRKHSAESRAKMSESRKAAWTPEHRAAMSRLQKGRRRSDEQRASMSANAQRMWQDDGFRERIAETRRNSETYQRACHELGKNCLGVKHSATRVAALAARSRKPVIDQHGNVYESVLAAALAHSVHYMCISNVLHGRRLHFRGLKFKFHDAEKG